MSYIFVIGPSRNGVSSELEILLSTRAQFVLNVFNSLSMFSIRAQFILGYQYDAILTRQLQLSIAY